MGLGVSISWCCCKCLGRLDGDLEQTGVSTYTRLGFAPPGDKKNAKIFFWVAVGHIWVKKYIKC